jgi:hypothetical protein|tara:strand:- start:1037 stop:1423 length:387 start_codon:yes stop_codon:yes gene_type:complete
MAKKTKTYRMSAYIWTRTGSGAFSIGRACRHRRVAKDKRGLVRNFLRGLGYRIYKVDARLSRTRPKMLPKGWKTGMVRLPGRVTFSAVVRALDAFNCCTGWNPFGQPDMVYAWVKLTHLKQSELKGLK